ncbi:peroxisomal copper amine oxidase [Thecaphora frezii]|nr:putative peroxisomal copper amine oxidase [Thecaphora frezii]
MDATPVAVDQAVLSQPLSPANHPLDPPSAREITAATYTFRIWLAENGVKAFKFITVMLKEPPKAAVIAALQWPGGYSSPAPAAGPIERLAEVHVIDLLTGEAYEGIVRLDGLQARVKDVKKLDKGIQPSITPEELCVAEKMIRRDERVIKYAADVGVKPEQIFADGWSIGWDKRFGEKRVQQCLLYARFGEHDNLYAHPMDFQPILDVNAGGEVLAIDFPYHRTTADKTLSSGTTAPPSEASFEDPQQRDRIPPPLEPFEYLPDLIKRELRSDLKPIHVTQPQGVSFARTGNVLEWSNFKVHVGFHPREGIVLSTLSYKDADRPGASLAQPEERPLFYRISLAEMVVPYGEPAWPHHRKFAFDVSEYSIGYLANSLSLGCDCLGSIEYMDGVVAKHDGSAEVIKNAICIHEEDTGLLWKHTDFREGGRAHAVRGRKLVISMICTVANYEYGIYWDLHTDGNIECEIKLTGILNLNVLGQGESPAGFGTEVMPRVNAQYHQHLFSLRIDPHIDGPNNSVVEQAVHMLPQPTGSAENYAGNGFTTTKTVLRTSRDAVRDAKADEERSWIFVNPRQKHYASGQPVGYKVVCANMPPLHCKPDSYVGRRAPFVKHHFWTVPYHDDQRYPAGKHVPQRFDAPADSIENWANEDRSIDDTDIVSFITFGTTHIPRPEDAPVMPAEVVRCMLKPVGFFRRNPTLTMPSTQDAKSVAAKAGGKTDEACCQKGKL